jgi:hypothetical protein
MPKPSQENEWKLKVNAEYQEAMRVVINLAAAALALPLVFLKIFVGAEQCNSHRLTPSAYVSWGLLLLSLGFGMAFYYASAKFVKAVCGGYDESVEKAREKWYEKSRDTWVRGVVACFAAGIVSLLWFFQTL